MIPSMAELQGDLLDSLRDEDDQALWEVAWRLDCSPGQPQADIDAKVALARKATLDLLRRGVIEIWRMDGWPPASFTPMSEAEFLAVQDDHLLWVAPEQAGAWFQIRLSSRSPVLDAPDAH